jgi:hypothetical protein
VLLAAALVLLPLVGCERDHIEIAIEPGPDGSFVRTIRLWHSDTEKKGQTLPATAALVEQAKAQYPKALETHDGTAAFQATFRMVPADLGRGNEMNRGGYTVWPSRLGYVGYYRERRPGRTDHYTRFREMADAVDLFVKLVSTIARQQLKGEKGLEQLAEFIEGPFHRDVKEAVFFVAHVDLTSAAQFDDRESERTLVSATAFIFQFAEERRYIDERRGAGRGHGPRGREDGPPARRRAAQAAGRPRRAPGGPGRLSGRPARAQAHREAV